MVTQILKKRLINVEFARFYIQNEVPVRFFSNFSIDNIDK